MLVGRMEILEVEVVVRVIKESLVLHIQEKGIMVGSVHQLVRVEEVVVVQDLLEKN